MATAPRSFLAAVRVPVPSVRARSGSVRGSSPQPRASARHPSPPRVSAAIPVPRPWAAVSQVQEGAPRRRILRRFGFLAAPGISLPAFPGRCAGRVRVSLCCGIGAGSVGLVERCDPKAAGGAGCWELGPVQRCLQGHGLPVLYSTEGARCVCRESRSHRQLRSRVAADQCSLGAVSYLPMCPTMDRRWDAAW